MNKAPLVYALAILIASPLPAFAEDYVGADLLLKKAATLAAEAKTPSKNTNADSPKKLVGDLKAFREDSATLAPEEAATRWFSFAERLSKFSPEELNEARGEENERNLSFLTLIESLPSPAAWAALAKVAEFRPEGKEAEGIRTNVLRLCIHWITQNTAAQDKDMAAFKAQFDQLKEPNRSYVQQTLDECQSQLLEYSDNGEAILANLNRQLTRKTEDPFQRRQINVPDLVTLVGEKNATDFFKKALKTKNVELNIQHGEETKSLARKLALQSVKEMQQPQWKLAESIDGVALYEAMAKKFPKTGTGEREYNRRDAQAYYLLSLIMAQRTNEAIGVARELTDGDNASLPEDGLAALERGGHTAAVAAFLHDLLEQKPDLPFWNEYVGIAPKAGQADKMVSLAKSASQREGLSPKQRCAVLKVLARAYLAADNVEKGIETMRKQIAIAKTIPESANSSYSEVTDSASTLATLGIVLERKDITDEGIQAIRDSLKDTTASRDRNRTNTALQTLARLLTNSHRGPEAEAALGEILGKLQQPVRGQYTDYYGMRNALCKLMALYHQANRPADVLTLLDRAPFWGCKDLKEIYSESETLNHNEDYVGYFAASALVATGRNKEALPILETLLQEHGGYDPAYELLIQIAPDTAMAKLDALFARDPFEERPLIWKAKLLLKAGQLEEAEKCARQAISIDPTDGEEGPGRRLRAYATLGEIREARGDKKEAEFLKEVLTSVRHSDQADQMHEVGLVTRALKLYEESLTHFADAYCIQARLAFRKAELGDMTGAEEHYRRAYELMPNQFGRVESYCFGCEGAFRGAQAQGIAERVFTKLAKESPEKPQIHYLLGYLRDEQNRYADALIEFRQAVKIDPDYLNAWKKIAEVSENMRLPAAERDAIQLNLLRLDPLGRHSSFQFDRVSNLSAAWTAMENAAKLEKPAPENLYPLAASAEEITKQQEEAAKNHGRSYYGNFSSSNRRNESPGKKISEMSFMNSLNQFFMYAPQIFRE